MDTKISVIYVRVSTAEQKQKAISPEVQAKECLEAVMKDSKLGYQYLKTIYDLGHSGGTMKRDGIQEIIQLAKEGKIQAVYTISSDRLSRMTEEYIGFRNLLKKCGVEIRYTKQANLVYNAAGITMDEVMASFNQMHRLQTSEKVKDTLYAKAEAGYFPELAPLGYKNIDNPNKSESKIDQKIIVPDPEAVPLIQEAFKLYATGNFNGYDLNDLMYEKGLRTKPKKMNGVLNTGHKLAPSRFYALLKNRFYIGELRWGHIYVEKAQHEAIIDKDTFNKVQQVMAGHNYHACRRRKHSFLLNGFVYCHLHQKRYTAEWHLNKKIAYYHCTNKHGCGKYIRTEKLEEAIAKKFQELQFSETFVNKVIEKAKRTFYIRRSEYEAKRQGLVNQKTALDAKLKVAEDKLFSNIIADADFLRIRDEVKIELKNLDKKMFELESKQEANVDIAQEIIHFSKDIYQTYINASPTLKRNYLAFFWDRFEVQEGVIIKYNPSLLFAELLKLEHAFYKNQKKQNHQFPGDSAKPDKVIITDTWLNTVDAVRTWYMENGFVFIATDKPRG